MSVYGGKWGYKNNKRDGVAQRKRMGRIRHPDSPSASIPGGIFYFLNFPVYSVDI